LDQPIIGSLFILTLSFIISYTIELSTSSDVSSLNLCKIRFISESWSKSYLTTCFEFVQERLPINLKQAFLTSTLGEDLANTIKYLKFSSFNGVDDISSLIHILWRILNVSSLTPFSPTGTTEVFLTCI